MRPGRRWPVWPRRNGAAQSNGHYNAPVSSKCPSNLLCRAVSVRVPVCLQWDRRGPFCCSDQIGGDGRFEKSSHLHFPPHLGSPSHRQQKSPALRPRSEEHTSELQSPCNLVCRLLLEKKKTSAH